MFQKYLLGKETISQEAYQNADVIEDQIVNIYDFVALKRKVLEEQGSESSGTSVVASIVYADNSVSLYDADGNPITAGEASNVTVTDGSYVTITKDGEYSVSGSCENGQIKVNTDNTAEPKATVVLNFEELTLSNANVAPVYVENVGKEVTISAKKGTVNTISDGTAHTDSYENSDGETKAINAAIFSRDDLKFKGKGTLIVNGNYQDGIVTKNDLKIWNSNITVNAQDDGIRGDNSVRIGDPDTLVANGGDGDYSNLSVTVTTKSGDGIKSNETSDGKGYVTINGGTVNITAYADGIQAEQEFTMNGGDVTIYTYEGSNYTGNGSSSSNGGWGGFGGFGGQDGNSNKTDISAKGIKAIGLYDEAGTTWQSGGNLTINAGNLVIDSSDDSLHCGGDMALTGGNLTLSSADDAAHADHKLTIGTSGAGVYDDVVISVPKSYEGIEAQQIYQYSGSVVINSTDDGYNAAGGADGSGNSNAGPGGGWGQGGWGQSSGSSGDYLMQFDGGFALVNATDGDHDGYDSNGDIVINGGYVISNGNEPFDCGDGGSSITVNGGVWVSNCGSGGMSMGGSEMTAVAAASGSVSAGTRVSVVDASGNVVVSWIADKNVSQ
ncbi:MAG: carbohydrate-binding domain-containing protein, partial [Oscillospiraceae bacterium]|nr:carbohydrate-binding domain-containing protein [Oscillospiraceae bacterium]